MQSANRIETFPQKEGGFRLHTFILKQNKEEKKRGQSTIQKTETKKAKDKTFPINRDTILAEKTIDQISKPSKAIRRAV